VLSQVRFGTGSETVVHAVGASGFALLALSFLDFALPRRVAAAGFAAAGALGAIFALQGLSAAIPDEALNDVAYALLGDLPERIAIDVLLLCLLALCLFESRGATRVLGLLTLLALAAAEAYRITPLVSGASESAGLRLVCLLPFVWLLESRGRVSLEAER
jgi:hypothetical protein